MSKIFEKSRYSACLYHTEEGKRHIVKHYIFGEDFEHLKAFKDFCNENGYRISYHPMEAAKSYRNVQYLKSITQ